MTNKHTPGPWVAGRSDIQTLVDGYSSKWIYDGKDQYVAVASGRIDGPWEEVMANAHLIAASPVMLDVLAQVEAYLDYRVGNKPESRGYSVLTDVRAAIAKAKSHEK